MTIAKIIQEIAATSSTNEKKAILEKNKDNPVLQKVFLKTYNPRLKYYIKAPTQMPKTGTGTITEYLLDRLNKLSKREVTGQLARDYFIDMLMQVDAESQKVLCNVLDGDLRCGASTTLANKIWKNLIPEYPVMLCSKMDDKARIYLHKVGPYFAQKKSDGGRVNIVVNLDGSVEYFSRNGSPLELFNTFDELFKPFPGYMFDGELLVKIDGKIADRKTSNGDFTRAVRGTLTKEQADRFVFDVWDMVHLEDFWDNEGITQYKDRFAQLATTVEKMNQGNTNPRVEIVESIITYSLDECMEFYAKMREQGEEGAIIKVASSLWENARSKNLVKLKAEESADLVCVGAEKGTGKYSDMIGNLICETSDGKLRVGVGTGLKDEDRALPIGHFLGKIIEVKYNEVITSKGKDTASLFLPVYMQIRHDKNTANSLSELK